MRWLLPEHVEDVLPAETVFYALLRDAHHPFFKGYTQLVKSYGEPPSSSLPPFPR